MKRGCIFLLIVVVLCVSFSKTIADSHQKSSFSSHKKLLAQSKQASNPFIEKIRKIPGQEFLLIYPAFTVVVIIIGRILSSFDDSLQYQPPEVTELDEYSIAALRGGYDAVVKTAIFKLWDSKYLDTIDERGCLHVIADEHKPALHDPIDRRIYEYYSTSKLPSAIDRLVYDPQLRFFIDALLQDLSGRHLLRTAEYKKRVWLITGIALVFLLTFGGIKLYLGITRGKPVEFLIVEIIAASACAIFIIKPFERLSRLGKRHIKNLKKYFGFSDAAILAGSVAPNAALAAVALVGTSMITSNPRYQAFSEVFPVSSGSDGCSDSGGCGDGCGGGCGGCGGCGD